jgi:transglutaminase-like putative cysteine protease
MDQSQAERRWDTPASLLLLFALLFVGGRLAITDWVPHMPYVVPLVLLGGALGLALGASRFGRVITALLAIAYTLVVVPWQVSYIIQDTPDWTERFASLGGRLLNSLALLVSNRQVDDYALFLTVMCLLSWGLAVFSGFALSRRRDLLGALVPGGLAIVIISIYDFYAVNRMAYLAFYLFLGLALLGRLNYLQSRRDWAARHVYVSPDATTDLSVSILVSAALVVVAAWTLPMSVQEYKNAAQFWSDAAKPLKGVREKLRDAFAAVRQPVLITGRDYYSQELALGTGSKHSDAVLFTVKAPPEALQMPRLYWRGVAYDHYENGQWQSTAPDTARFQPEGEFLPLADTGTSLAARYIFTTNLGGHLLYTPAQAVWVSRAANVVYFPVEVASMDVESISAQNGFARGEVYQARAPVRDPTVADLRQASRNYPDWVTRTYLQLPANFSPKVRQLAQDLTRDSTNPYDKASAVTDYLRNTISYSERISSPPPGSDPIEWFLFDKKEGFCNYYASAEVLMLRSLGIPARLVAGFSQGERSPTGTTFTVRDSNAHAWPEVYFPGFGWMEFEPTANQDALIRPAGFIGGGLSPLTPEAPLARARPTEPGDLTLPQGRPTPVRSAPVTALVWFGIFVLTVVLFLALRRGRLVRPIVLQRTSVGLRDYLVAQGIPAPRWLNDWVLWLQMSTIERSFHAINQSLRWLGDPPPSHATPAERAAALQKLLPDARDDIEALLAEQHAHVFSPKPGDTARAALAARRVRYLALRRRISRPFLRDRK